MACLSSRGQGRHLPRLRRSVARGRHLCVGGTEGLETSARRSTGHPGGCAGVETCHLRRWRSAFYSRDQRSEGRPNIIMKLVRAKIYLLRIAPLHPILVELITDEGLVGVGEAGVAYGIGGAAAAGMIKDLVEGLLLGKDPSRIEALWTEMYDHSFWAKGGGPIVFAGISRIEQGPWDIKGKALEVPVYELLGGKFRDHVRAYANGWSYTCVTPDDYARAAERVVGDGYTALKCYPLSTPNGGAGITHVALRSVDRTFADLAFDKVRAVRRAAGGGVNINGDIHRAVGAVHATWCSPCLDGVQTHLTA